MSEPADLPAAVARDLHALRADVHAMAGRVGSVAEAVARMEGALGALTSKTDAQDRVNETFRTAVAEMREQIAAVRTATAADIAALRLEFATARAASALPLKGVIALGALVLVTVAGVVISSAMRQPSQPPQIIVQQPASRAP